MSKGGGSSTHTHTQDVMKKWQAAQEWKDTTRGVVKQATKFNEMLSSLTEEGDTLTEELLKVHKLLAGPDSDGLPDGDILECSVMVLRNNIKFFVIMQREMMARIFESFDTPLSNAVDMEMMDSHETKRLYVKALAEYDENKTKIQENIKKKKVDPEIILACEKELDRLSLTTESLKATFDNLLTNLTAKRSIVYSKCMLQLMDKHHEFFLNGWDVLADIRPRLAALEDHLSRADDKAPNLIKEGYLMKKTGFGWTKCWVSVQIQQKKPTLRTSSSDTNSIILSWQPTTAKPSKDGRRRVDVCLCTVRLRPSAGEFEVVTPSKKRPLILQAETDSERTAWMDALLLAISLGLQGINNHLPQQTQQKETSDGEGDSTPGSGSGISQKLDPSVLQRVEGNNVCADCDSPDPDWASINLGILLCLECSGVHRNMGTHISKVRSLNLDVWDPETVLLAQRLGNRRVNTFYEANTAKVAANKPARNTEREARMRYVQGKYKDLRFIDDERKGSASGMLGVMLCEATARNSDVMDVLMLLALGADPNMLGPGPDTMTTLVTPMISATFHNNLAMLELLLLNGADVFVSDANGWSALQHAVSFKSVQCASLFLRRGFSGKTAQPVELRAIALELAESLNDDQMVRLLKLEGSAVQKVDDDTKQLVMQMSPASPVNQPLAKLRSPLTRSLTISMGAGIPRSLDMSSLSDEEDSGVGAGGSGSREGSTGGDSRSTSPIPFPASPTRRPSQPTLSGSLSPSMPIRTRPMSRTAAPYPTSLTNSPLSSSAPISPPGSPSAFPSVPSLSSKSSFSPYSPTRPLALSQSFESNSPNPYLDISDSSDRLQFEENDPSPEKQSSSSSRRFFKRHTKSKSVSGDMVEHDESRKERKEREREQKEREKERERELKEKEKEREREQKEREREQKEREKEREKEMKEMVREKEKEQKEREKELKELEKEREREQKEREKEQKEREKEKAKEKEKDKDRDDKEAPSDNSKEKGPVARENSKDKNLNPKETRERSNSSGTKEKGFLGRDRSNSSGKGRDRSNSSAKEKDKEKDKDKDKEKEKDKDKDKEKDKDGAKEKDTKETVRENSKENLRDYIKGKLKKDRDRDFAEFSTSSAPTSPSFSSHHDYHLSPPLASSTSLPASPSFSSQPPQPLPIPEELTASYSTYSYSPLPTTPVAHGYSPLPSYPNHSTNDDDDDDYPDPTPIPPDLSVINQVENPDEKQFFALSTQLVELVNTLKNLVKDEPTKKISSSVSTALKDIETFANKEKLPPPQHVIHDKDQLQQKLNRVLGYVSTLGRAYQQQHTLPVLSSSVDEAVHRYCTALSKACKTLEEALE